MSQGKPGVAKARPLSPHLQVWRWHITMAGSILTRATGVALYVGALILAGWAVSLASGQDSYIAYMGMLGTPLGRLVMLGLTFSLFYHLAAGIRHLFWDAGLGFDPKFADLTGAASIAFAVVATLVTWIIAAMTGAL
jgi:succinate dehydrogenase / fumarate reductase cytochrome b subunit